METKSFADNWLSLGDLESKKIFLKDEIIPECKRDNIDIFSSGYWIKQKHELYYFKTRENEFLLRELLGESVSEYFNIPTVRYELAKGIIQKQEVYGLLSKYARAKNKRYKTLQECLKDYNYSSLCGVDIVDAVDNIWHGAPITEDIYAFLVRDFFTNEWDRLPSEILIELSSVPRLGYLCDYEYEFTDIKTKIAIPRLYYMSFENEFILDKIQRDEMFKKYFEKALKINLTEMLEKLCQEKKLRLDSSVYDLYQTFEQSQKELISKKLSL